MKSRTRFFGRVVSLRAAMVLVTSCGAFAATPEDEKNAQKFGISAETVQQIRRSTSLTNQALDKLPADKLRELLSRVAQPDLPRLRAEFRLRQESDENGEPPASALRLAVQQLRAARKTLSKSSVAGLPTGREVDPAFLSFRGTVESGRWKCLGPFHVGGRTRSIVIDPTNPARFWVGSVGGGIWQTSDDGQHFSAVDDVMASLSVSCLAINPINPKMLFAGTGEGIYYWSVPRGAGIFGTTDGVHWNIVTSTATVDFQYVNRLAFSADGKVLFAAITQPEGNTNGGIFRSDDPPHQKWKRVYDGQFVDVKCHPTDPRKLIAATSDGVVVYSNDQGASGSWHDAVHSDPWTSRVELAYCQKNPTIIYASVDTNGGEIWRSSDDGQTFLRRTSQLPNPDEHGARQLAYYLGDGGEYANCIWAGDPTNEDFVLVGGLNLFRSSDGGTTLVDISNWTKPASAHADHHAIVPSPGFNGTTNKTVYFGNDGGIYKTADVYTVGDDEDRTQGWVNLNNHYAVTQFYGAAGNASGIVVGGSQDNGTIRYSPDNPSAPWKFIFGGDGGFCAADPDDPNILYGEYVFGDVHRNSDNGEKDSINISGRFTDGGDCWKPVPFTIPDVPQRRAQFIAPFLLDPNNAERLLVGCRSLWRTMNAKAPVTDQTGPTWTEIKRPVSERDDISALAIPVGEPDVIWAGYSNGRIFKTTNGLKELPDWTELHAGSGAHFPRRYCHRLTIDPRNHDVVYATFGGYHVGNIWKTIDGGMRWTLVKDPLSAPVPVRDLAINPGRSDYLYLATEVGVFSSEDGGKTWSATKEGPTSCCVDQLFWMSNTLIAVTHGRGIFAIDLSKVASAQ